MEETVDLSWLDDLLNNTTDGLVEKNNGMLEAARQAKIANGISNGLGIANGLVGIYGIANRASQIQQDDPRFSQALGMMRGAGTYGYSDYGQVLSEMDNMRQYGIRRDEDDVRGMTAGQKWGNVGQGALAGASAGMAFGPWGAAIGGLLGAAGAGLGVLNGDTEARVQTAADNYNMQHAEQLAQLNYNTALENIANRNHVQKAVHAVANGGKIKRQLTAKEYASRVLGQKSTFFRPTRQYCNGGVKVRIKVK